MACGAVNISKMIVYDTFIYCSYMFFILDVLYCYHITFYFCNQPSYINIKFTIIIFPIQSAYQHLSYFILIFLS